MNNHHHVKRYISVYGRLAHHCQLLDSDFVKYVKALGPWTCEKQSRVRWLSKHQSTWTEGVRLVSLPPSSKLDSQVLFTLDWSTTCHMVMALSIWSWLHLKWP